jgi:hypothetical protein
MVEEAPTAGSESSSFFTKKKKAAESHLFNAKAPLFCQLFPELIQVEKGRKMLHLVKLEENRRHLHLVMGAIFAIVLFILYKLFF